MSTPITTQYRGRVRVLRLLAGASACVVAGSLLGACVVPREVAVESGAATAESQGRSATEVPGIGADPILDGRTYYEEAVLREEVIAHCMAKRGFSYDANPPFIASVDDTTPAPPDDPNAAARAAMSPEELEAYDMAFAGVPDANAVDLPPEEERIDGGGCLGLAHGLIPGLYRVDPELTTEAALLRQDFTPSNEPGCVEAHLGVETPEALDEGVVDGSVSADALAEAEEACAAEPSVGSERAGGQLLETLQRLVDDNADRIDAFLNRLEADRRRAAEYLES